MTKTQHLYTSLFCLCAGFLQTFINTTTTFGPGDFLKICMSRDKMVLTATIIQHITEIKAELDSGDKKINLKTSPKFY